MVPQPRVAVVGGGIAGTLCSLVLKHRGIHPTLIDGGRHGMGGRLRTNGAQFFRAADPRLATVLGMLEKQGLVAEWKGRFGMLGSSGGGFLPADIVTRNTSFAGRGMETAGGSNTGTKDKAIISAAAASDGGDFCHFVDGSTVPTYVGIPSMTDLCPEICRLAGIQEINNSKLVAARPLKEGGWKLNVVQQNNNNGSRNAQIMMIDPDEKFDALVLAIHNPSVASGVIRSIVDAELLAGGFTSAEDATAKNKNNDDADDDNASVVIGRLVEIADSLHKVRETDRMPVYAVSITYPSGFSRDIPFDAVTIPGSHVVQFLARDASKPGQSTAANNGETWTAISTSSLASSVLSNPTLSEEDKRAQVSGSVTNEIHKLLAATYHNNNNKGKAPPEPLGVAVKRWGAAFCSKGLQLREDSILLAPWRLTVCGDFVRDLSAHATPLEAAALSGLEAGERTASFWATTTMHEPDYSTS